MKFNGSCYARLCAFFLPCALLVTFILWDSGILVSAARRSSNSLAVVSAASYNGASLARAEIVVAFGDNLSTVTETAKSRPLSTTLGGVSVLIRDSNQTERQAPLFYVSPKQINFLIPPETSIGQAQITVIKDGVSGPAGVFQITNVAPSLFTANANGAGVASAYALRVTGDAQTTEAVSRFDNGQKAFISIPIHLGAAGEQLYLILYGTGIRNRVGPDPARVSIGGVNAEVAYAGPQGDFDGLDQINLKIPREAATGEMDLVVAVDGQTSNTVRVNLAPPPVETQYIATIRPEGSALSPASGYSTLKLSADEKSAIIRFQYSNLTTPETSAHIHGPANPGQNGQILFDLDTSPKQQDGSYEWKLADVGVTTVAQIVQALKSGRLYINIHSSRYPSGEIRGHYGVITGSQSFSPPPAPPPLPTGAPTARDAARFLSQATFGPRTTADITTVQTKGYDGWLNEQFAKPIARHMDYLDVATRGRKYTDLYQHEMMESFWNQAVTGDDQLRQRVVFALSQITVVSFKSTLESEEYALASYVDVLAKNAFGNYRQLLQDITLNPAMGRYLDMLGNDKEDPATGRNPNENFAREVLQLFSIGLYQLHPDGTLVLDSAGAPIPTYNQETIKGFAHAFTGWSYGSFPLTEQYWLYPPIYADGAQCYRVPMQAYPDHHSTDAKQLLNGKILPAGQSAQKDLSDALDNIFNHPNLGPFIARQLIQRLVTSSPSTDYVYRVAQKFNNNGAGVRGDLKAVIRAALTDYEARSLEAVKNQGYGKLREPIVRFAHLLRAFNYSCPCGTFPIYWMDSPKDSIGQGPLRSPSVFNYFEPGYSNPGRIAAAGLSSPEFQLLNETSVIGISGFFHYVLRDGFNWEAGKPLRPNYSAYLPLASNVPQLIDQLDLILTAGAMSPELKSRLIQEISKISALEPQSRIAAAAHLILTSPDYVIQK
jgi:uncharacterized protein (TIGR03437 family)